MTKTEILSVESLVADLSAGRITSCELVEKFQRNIASRNRELNIFLRLYDEEALAQADASDERRANGQALSEIDGLPVAIKDNISYGEHLVTAGSRMLADYVAPYDATVVGKLKEAGAIILGSLNMDEFAMGSSGENSAFGATKNPLDPTRVPGGSSSGAAAAVAADMAPLTLGSDTGGSIRQPAAYCGVVGLKPTYGAVSRYGLLAMASSLDQIGPLAKTVAGVEIGFRHISGFDRRDSTAEDQPFRRPIKRYRVGLPKQFNGPGLAPEIAVALAASLERLESAGHAVRRDIDIPLLEKSLAVYYIIMSAEVSANLARYDGVRFGLRRRDIVAARSDGFGDEVKRRIMLGTYALSAGYSDKYYRRAQAARQAITEKIDAAFGSVDVLIGPVSPTLPFALGEKNHDPLAMYLSDVYTIPVNLAGLPALSVPVARPSGRDHLAVGLQLIGPRWSEPWLFDLGRQLEMTEAI